MANPPPPGYDDASVIHKSQLKNLLDLFEGQLQKILHNLEEEESSFELSQQLVDSFLELKKASLEFGADYSKLMDQLLEEYDQISKKPDPETLSKIFSTVKSLQLILAQSH
jgi:hypothetical protein